MVSTSKEGQVNRILGQNKRARKVCGARVTGWEWYNRKSRAEELIRRSLDQEEIELLWHHYLENQPQSKYVAIYSYIAGARLVRGVSSDVGAIKTF